MVVGRVMTSIASVCAFAVVFSASAPGFAATVDVTTFHRNPQRTGWDDREPDLTPQSLSSGAFRALWESPPFDAAGGEPARSYASPLYVDKVRLSDGEFEGRTFSVVLAATSNGMVYAVNAFQSGAVPPGTILWRAQLGKPCNPGFDGVNIGVLSTPLVDLHRDTLYVTSCEGRYEWKAYAIDIRNGKPLPNWPVSIDAEALFRPGIAQNVERSAWPQSAPLSFLSQRGALNLSPDGRHLYVTFGESQAGWIVAVDTVSVAVVTAFATVASPHNYSGGIWGAGGPAVTETGRIFVATGTSFGGLTVQPHDWTQSVLELSDSGSQGLALRGTYTPFNYCVTAAADVDLGSGGISVIPDLGSASTATPCLAAVGGKQGNIYLINRAPLPGKLDQRPACSSDSSRDASLLSPQTQPQFSQPGPLNIFGPYTESAAAIDQARSRSLPAYFRASDGTSYLFATGNTKAGPDSSTNVPPCLARLKIVTRPGHPAHLEVNELEKTLIFENPGSPVVTSSGSRNAIVWVLDENARRSATLETDSTRPVLYALDAMTLKLLWRSQPNELHPSGKYNEPAIARGTVFVGTDRIQAFGIRRTEAASVR